MERKKKVNIGIIVHVGELASAASYSALLFAKAAIDQGHQIYRIFFYHEGVENANAFSVIPEDSFDLRPEWISLHKNHNVELAVCIGAAHRRGVKTDITDEISSKNLEIDMDSAFELVGLGQLADMTINADRVITFDA